MGGWGDGAGTRIGSGKGHRRRKQKAAYAGWAVSGFYAVIQANAFGNEPAPVIRSYLARGI